MNRGFGSLATRSLISKVAWLPVFVFLLEHFYDVALVEGRSMQVGGLFPPPPWYS